jgi:hypothetical protein
VYDSTTYANHGTTSGSWENDGILDTLVNGVDYTLSGKSIALNQDYLYSYIFFAYTYLTGSNERESRYDIFFNAISFLINNVLLLLVFIIIAIAVIWGIKNANFE